jgi:hypothetical protein
VAWGGFPWARHPGCHRVWFWLMLYFHQIWLQCLREVSGVMELRLSASVP